MRALTPLPAPAAGSAHVWAVELDQPAPRVRALHALLDADERGRAAAKVRDRDRDRFVVAHGALRQVLAAYRGAAPAALRFVRGPHGKPGLADGGPAFSLSHSDGLAVIAVGAGGSIGVDVERVRSRRALELVARRFFAAAEADLVLAAQGDARLRRFLRLWTAKESCVKEDGRGIAAIEDVEVTLRPDGTASAGPWTARELAVGSGYVGAVAARGELRSVVQRRWRAGGFACTEGVG